MDCIESPFPFDQVDELFPLPSLPSIDISIPELPLISSKDKTNKPKNERRRKSPTTSDDIECDLNGNENKRKKIIHRDVERQRRQEMSTLYSTLRTLLPLQYLKGKRSICDHMHETVKYIHEMQNKIQQLSHKRDELKRLSGECPNAATVETLHSSERDSLVVKPRYGGVQVVLDTATQHRLPISNVVEALADEGHQIISCITTKINDRFLHTVESESVDIGGQTVDLSDLQLKLTNLEYFPLD